MTFLKVDPIAEAEGAITQFQSLQDTTLKARATLEDQLQQLKREYETLRDTVIPEKELPKLTDRLATIQNRIVQTEILLTDFDKQRNFPSAQTLHDWFWSIHEGIRLYHQKSRDIVKSGVIKQIRKLFREDELEFLYRKSIAGREQISFEWEHQPVGSPNNFEDPELCPKGLWVSAIIRGIERFKAVKSRYDSLWRDLTGR